MSKPGTTFKVSYYVTFPESFGFDFEHDGSVCGFEDEETEVHEDGSVTIRHRITKFEFDEPVSDLDEAFDRIQAAFQTPPDAPVQIEIFSIVRVETSEMTFLQAVKQLHDKDGFGKWTDDHAQRLQELQELLDLHQWTGEGVYNHELPHDETDLIFGF